MPTEVSAEIDALIESTQALLHSIANLTDEQARAASLLPNWSRGHVLSHLARNADAMVNLVTSARTRTYVPMYRGRAERDADIESGAGRPAQDLVADVAATHEHLLTELASLSGQDWAAPIRYGGDDRHGDAALIPGLRRSEVEIHSVDLDLGYPFAQWPADFVAAMLDRVVGDFSARADTPRLTLVGQDGHRWEVRGGGQVVSGPAPALLGWMIGRSDGSGLTTDGELPRLGAWR